MTGVEKVKGVTCLKTRIRPSLQCYVSMESLNSSDMQQGDSTSGENEESHQMLDSLVCANISVSSVEVQGGLSCSETALFLSHHPSFSCVNKLLIALQTTLQLAHQTNAFSTTETHLIKQVQIYVFCIL